MSGSFNGSTLSIDEWIMKADHCRAWLHIHGLLPDSEDQKVKERCLKLMKPKVTPKQKAR